MGERATGERPSCVATCGELIAKALRELLALPLSPFRSPSPASASAPSSFGCSAEPVTRPNAVAEFMLYMIPARLTAMRGTAALALRVLLRRARCRRAGGPHSAPRPECQPPRSRSAFCSSCMCSFLLPVGEPAAPALSADAAAGGSFHAASLGADGFRVDVGDADAVDGGYDMVAAVAYEASISELARHVVAGLAALPADGAAGTLAWRSTEVGWRPVPAAVRKDPWTMISSGTVTARRDGGDGGIGDAATAAGVAAPNDGWADVDR